MDIKIIVATHKVYPMPDSSLYLPVQAGASFHERLPYQGDDTGENISSLNDVYCELTALYWAWKNMTLDGLGLCHYRRYFQDPTTRQILTEENAQKLLSKAPVILPQKRNYYIETGASQFVHAHGQKNLDVLREVLKDRFPSYLPTFDRTMSRTAGHRFNMMVMRWDYLDAYCSWLFDILFETQKRMGCPPPRMLGFLSERLMDAWIETDHVSYLELPVFHTEKENWLIKGSSFILRKIKGSAIKRKEES